VQGQDLSLAVLEDGWSGEGSPMDAAAAEFDILDTLMVSPEFQESVDRMQQSGLDNRQIIELIGSLVSGCDDARANCGTLALPH
jgi:hypothetical protein